MILMQRWFYLLCMQCNLCIWPNISVDTCSLLPLPVPAVVMKPIRIGMKAKEAWDHKYEHNTRISIFRHEYVQVSSCQHLNGYLESFQKQNHIIKATTGGSVKLILAMLVNLVSLQQSHCKHMGISSDGHPSVQQGQVRLISSIKASGVQQPISKTLGKLWCP